MAKVCAICGKRKSIGHTRKLLRGHYNITSRRGFVPNLQKISHQGHRINACVKCIRTLTKEARTASRS